MKSNSRTFAIALAITIAASLSGGQTSFAQDESDQQLPRVHFETSCNETAQRRFDRGMRYQHSFLAYPVVTHTPNM